MNIHTADADTRLIGNIRTGYIVLAGASLIGAFLMSAMFGTGAGTFALVLVGGTVIYGLFNVVGALRPKWLHLSPEGVRYRPVVGRERFVGWGDINSIDFVFISQGMGVLTYRDGLGQSHRLGLWLDISSVVREVEEWRTRTP